MALLGSANRVSSSISIAEEKKESNGKENILEVEDIKVYGACVWMS